MEELLSEEEGDLPEEGEVVAALTIEGTGYVGVVSGYDEEDEYAELELENVKVHRLVGSNNHSPWYRSDGDERTDEVTLVDTPIEEDIDSATELRYWRKVDDWEIERHLRDYEDWAGGPGRQGEISELGP